MRKIPLFIAMSLDGYIAKPNDGLTFLKLVEKAGGDYGYGENGTRLFKDGRLEQTLDLATTKTFDTGLAQLY